MRDNELIVLIRRQIIEGLTQMGPEFASTPVIQKNQPTQQGIPYERSVYFEKLYDRKRGWAKSTPAAVDETGLKFNVKDEQLIATHFQISALSIQDPADLNSVTASDIVNQLALFMNHRMTVETLMKSNVNVEMINELRNNPFEDDRHRSEYHPGFELVVTHQRDFTVVIDGALPDPDAKVFVVDGGGTPPHDITSDVVMI